MSSNALSCGRCVHVPSPRAIKNITPGSQVNVVQKHSHSPAHALLHSPRLRSPPLPAPGQRSVGPHLGPAHSMTTGFAVSHTLSQPATPSLLSFAHRSMKQQRQPKNRLSNLSDFNMSSLQITRRQCAPSSFIGLLSGTSEHTPKINMAETEFQATSQRNHTQQRGAGQCAAVTEVAEAHEKRVCLERALCGHLKNAVPATSSVTALAAHTAQRLHPRIPQPRPRSVLSLALGGHPSPGQQLPRPIAPASACFLCCQPPTQQRLLTCTALGQPTVTSNHTHPSSQPSPHEAAAPPYSTFH